MKEETHDINEIIIRYLDGSAELEEKRLLLRWLKQSDDNRDDFIATRDLWLSRNVAARSNSRSRAAACISLSSSFKYFPILPMLFSSETCSRLPERICFLLRPRFSSAVP